MPAAVISIRSLRAITLPTAKWRPGAAAAGRSRCGWTSFAEITSMTNQQAENDLGLDLGV
jgi:hypothetical protein